MNFMKKKQRVYILQLLLIIFAPLYRSFCVNCIHHHIHCHGRDLLAFQQGTVTTFPHPPNTSDTTRIIRSRKSHYPYRLYHSSRIEVFMSSSSKPSDSGDNCQPIDPDATIATTTTTIKEPVTTTTTRPTGSSPEAIAAAVEFANLVGQLKITPRTGWLRRNIVPCESVADHSWRVAILAFLLLSQSNTNHSNDTSKNDKNYSCNGFDIGKVIQIALIHDVAECIVGDITPEDNVSKHDKHQLEYEAMQQITKLLHLATSTTNDDKKNVDDSSAESSVSKLEDNLLMKLFHEYEERYSIESIIVKDLDLLDMILQANTYEIQYPNNIHDIDLSDFFIGTPPSRFQIPQIRQIAEYIHQQRYDRLHTVHNDNNNTTKINHPTGNTELLLLPIDNGDNMTQSNIDSVVMDPSSNHMNNVSLSKSDLAFIQEYSQLTTTTVSPPSMDIDVATTSTHDIVAATVLALRQWDQMHHKSIEKDEL